MSDTPSEFVPVEKQDPSIILASQKDRRKRRKPPKTNKMVVPVVIFGILIVCMIATMIPSLFPSEKAVEEAQTMSGSNSSFVLAPSYGSLNSQESTDKGKGFSVKKPDAILGKSPGSISERQKSSEGGSNGGYESTRSTRTTPVPEVPFDNSDMFVKAAGMLPTPSPSPTPTPSMNKNETAGKNETSQAPGYGAFNSTVVGQNENGGVPLATDLIGSMKTVNDQAGKVAFEKNLELRQGSAATATQDDNPTTIIKAGTFIAARLQTSINTDLPGPIKAYVTQNVYDSLSGKNILIPQGSVLLASYNSSIAYGQSRVQIGWYSLIRPDGVEISLGNMPGLDQQGAAGMTGDTDVHILNYIGSFLVTTVLNLSNTLSGNLSANLNKTQNSVVTSSSDYVDQVGAQLLSAVAVMQPTIRIASGSNLVVFVSQNLRLPVSNIKRPPIPYK